MVENTPASGRARAAASLADLGVIAAWLGVLGAAGALSRRSAIPSSPSGAGRRASPGLDLGVFAATVLPAGVYLVTGEAGQRQGSLGKRWAGLRVVDDAGHRPTTAAVALRAAVKLLPWQLAHLAVTRIILDAEQPVRTWTSYGLSLALPAASVAMAWRDPAGRALHDRVSGTRVVSGAARRPSARPAG